MRAAGTCNYCGKDIKGKYEGQCQRGGFVGCGKFLCKKCAVTCKKCRKIFCPKHIKDHKCK